jgi:hypothetical protein
MFELDHPAPEHAGKQFPCAEEVTFRKGLPSEIS